MKKFDICTLGSITLDTFIEPQEVIFHKTKDGRMHMDFEIGQKIPIKTLSRHVGGCSANSAVGLSRLGIKVAALGTIGHDDHGDFILHRLERMKVNTDFVTIKKRVPTSASLIFMTEGGKRTIFEESTAHESYHDLPKTHAVYLGHAHGKERDIFDRLIVWKEKSKRKKFIAWNPGKTQFKEGFHSFRKFFPYVDMLILNREEAELFTEMKTRLMQPRHMDIEKLWKHTAGFQKHDGTIANMQRIAQKFLDAGVKAVIITDGVRGAQYISQKEYLWAPTVSDRTPVSTLGAGDAFSAGCIAAALYGKSPKTQMRWGTLNSDAVIRVFGAQEGQLKKKDMR